MDKTVTLRIVCTDDGSLKVHEQNPIAKADDRELIKIDSRTFQYLDWWTHDTEECSDTSASQATALIVQKLEDLGYEHIDYQTVYRVIRRVCDAGPPIRLGERTFDALKRVPDTRKPPQPVWEVWHDHGIGTFKKFTGANDMINLTWHVREVMLAAPVGTHMHIVKHSSDEYHR